MQRGTCKAAQGPIHLPLSPNLASPSSVPGGERRGRCLCHAPGAGVCRPGGRTGHEPNPILGDWKGLQEDDEPLAHPWQHRGAEPCTHRRSPAGRRPRCSSGLAAASQADAISHRSLTRDRWWRDAAGEVPVFRVMERRSVQSREALQYRGSVLAGVGSRAGRREHPLLLAGWCRQEGAPPAPGQAGRGAGRREQAAGYSSPAAWQEMLRARGTRSLVLCSSVRICACVFDPCVGAEARACTHPWVPRLCQHPVHRR